MNAATLDRSDSDLGSGGPLWLPPGLIVGGGKEGRYGLLHARTLARAESLDADRWADGFQAFVNSYHADPRAPACGQQTRSSFPTNCDTAAVPGCYVAPARYGEGEDCGPNINGSPVYWSAAGPGYGLVYQMAGARLPQGLPLRPGGPPPRRDAVRHLAGTRGRGDVGRVPRAVGERRSRRASSGCRIRWATGSGRTCRGGWRRSTPGRCASSGTTTAATCSPSSPRRPSPAAASSGRRSRGRWWSTAFARRRCPRSPWRRAADWLAARFGVAAGAAARAGRSGRGRRQVQAGGRRERLSGKAGVRRAPGPGRGRRVVPATFRASPSGRSRRRSRCVTSRPRRRPRRAATRGWGWGRRSSHRSTGRRPTGAHIVTGEIRDRLARPRRAGGAARLPDRRRGAGARRRAGVCRFAGGTVTWSVEVGAAIDAPGH